MRKQEIEEFIRKQEKISQRNYMNYQETGTSRYLNAHEKAENLVDIARQALSAADDHQTVGTYSAYISQWGTKAVHLLHSGRVDDPEVRSLLSDIKTYAVMRGLTNDPWRGEK